MGLTISSSAFRHGETIPAKYTCAGQNVSPPLQWSGAPAGTECFALIVDDPDAPGGTFNHWVLFNIPGGTLRLEEGASPEGTLQGMTSYGETGWGGPCPPKGPAHHYHFILFALDKVLALKAGASKQRVLEEVNGHMLERAETVGLYQRK